MVRMSPAARSTAYTGKRWIMMKPGWRCKDHPRMRGKVQLLPVYHNQVRITPAYAGKSVEEVDRLVVL